VQAGLGEAAHEVQGEAYILTKEEGGRHTPFFTNYRPQFYFRTTDVTGIVKLPEGTEMVMPGDNISIEVELIVPIAMEEKAALRHPRRRPHRRRRRRRGAPAALSASLPFFLSPNVTIQGQANRYERPAESGFAVTHHFCPACGSMVFWLPARRPSHVAVALGAFADPGFPLPSKSVYEQHQHSWVRLFLQELLVGFLRSALVA
jgi:hypothetical protein